MARLLFVCMLAASAVFCSCGEYSKRKKQQLYTQIKTTNDTLIKMTKDWHILLRRAGKEKNYTALRPQRLRLGEYLNRKREEISKVSVYTYNVAIIDKEQAYLNGRAAIVSDVYPPFEMFNALTPIIEVQDQLASVSDDLYATVAGAAKMERSLKVYAKLNQVNVKKK